MDKFEPNILFLGGDKRQEHIYKLIKEKYFNTSIAAFQDNVLERKTLREAEIIIFPTITSNDNYTLNAPEYSEAIMLEDVIATSVKAVAFICGKIPQSFKNNIELSGKKCYQYLESAPFKILNAIPTAEAAISIAVCNRNKTLWGSKSLVIGNGCIGKALSRLLQCYGSDVTVAARKDADIADISRKGYRSLYTKEINEHLSNFDLIFNTVPARVIDKEAIAELDHNKLLIELASKPYGFDNNYIDECKCKIIIASSLPGKYSPKTAAEIAAVTIEQFINEVKSYA